MDGVEYHRILVIQFDLKLKRSEISSNLKPKPATVSTCVSSQTDDSKLKFIQFSRLKQMQMSIHLFCENKQRDTSYRTMSCNLISTSFGG